MKRFIFDELFVDLGVVFEEGEHDFGESFVVFDAGDAVSVSEEGAEVFVEGFEDVAEAVEFGFAFAAAAFDGDGADFGVFVG